MHLLQVVLNAKSQELINVFSETLPDEGRRVVAILSEIDPSNASKYQAILSSPVTAKNTQTGNHA
jgi:hypothetical protein